MGHNTSATCSGMVLEDGSMQHGNPILRVSDTIGSRKQFLGQGYTEVKCNNYEFPSDLQ